MVFLFSGDCSEGDRRGAGAPTDPPLEISVPGLGAECTGKLIPVPALISENFTLDR